MNLIGQFSLVGSPGKHLKSDLTYVKKRIVPSGFPFMI